MVTGQAKELIAQTEAIVSPVYLVGGSIRDLLLGRPVDDWDFTTPMIPDEVEARIKSAGKRAYNLGKRFGTMGMTFEGVKVEITTFRSESYDGKTRKPSVQFVKKLHEDLSRRDFTINAIAYRKRIVDPFGGRKDLKDGVIRAVGNARQRFKEDPLRLLRAARFASQLGFTVDDDTTEKASERSHSILNVSKERWMQELDKLLVSDNPCVGLDWLIDTRVMNFVIPELSLQVGYDQNSHYHNLTLWEHTKAVVRATPPNIVLRWAALLHDIAKPFVRTDREDRSNYIKHDLLGADMTERIACHLRWSNARREEVVDLVFNHLRDDCPLRKYDQAGKIIDVGNEV